MIQELSSEILRGEMENLGNTAYLTFMPEPYPCYPWFVFFE